ncbi:hypothetical protein [Rhizobium ruizarguesonis]|uniref:hypothetical protein n=2 Tax=Rhizobium TaxID=379 RepID=UPI00103098DB|nr:hypothetical protein [Rhizobium ruizarguesonis]TBC57097.1 hypothetical protein ELH32_08255 [Rhizobium ruizarguesonis]
MTRVRQIVRFMKELEAGFDRTTLPLPATTVFLKADSEITGTTVPFEIEVDEDDSDDTHPSLPWMWRGTSESTATRSYPARTKAHSRGSLVHPIAHRAISFASTFELACAMMLSANRRIALVEDQPAAVLHTRPDGTHEHTFDYRATLQNGYRVAIAVRPSWLIEKDNLSDTIHRIRSGFLAGFADEAVILTERQLTRARGWNAQTILLAIRNSAAADNDRLRDFAFRFQGTVAIRTLIDIFDTPAAGWNAVWCLVYQGTLIPARPDMKLIDAPFVSFNHHTLH